jgi:hypothetical protein
LIIFQFYPLPLANVGTRPRRRFGQIGAGLAQVLQIQYVALTARSASELALRSSKTAGLTADITRKEVENGAKPSFLSDIAQATRRFDTS